MAPGTLKDPQRVKIAHDILKAKGYEFVEPKPANDEEILSVHDADYLFNVKKGLVEDSDTPAYKNIYEFAQTLRWRSTLSQQNQWFFTYASTWTSCWKKWCSIRRLHTWILLPKQHRNSRKRIRKTHFNLRHRWTSWEWHTRNFSRRRKSCLMFLCINHLITLEQAISPKETA